MFRLTEPVIFQIFFLSSVTCDSPHFQASFSDWSDAQETEGGQVITAAWPPPTPPAGLATLSGPEYEEPVYSFSYSQTNWMFDPTHWKRSGRWMMHRTDNYYNDSHLPISGGKMYSWGEKGRCGVNCWDMGVYLHNVLSGWNQSRASACSILKLELCLKARHADLLHFSGGIKIKCNLSHTIYWIQAVLFY